MIIAIPAVIWFAAPAGDAGQASALIAGARVLAAALGAIPVGVILALLFTRESHLFKYFKER